MSDNSLITKYRPQSFSEVVGHKDILKSLQNTLKKNLARSFIFTGPPGTGKTTLARIIAKEVGCKNVVEVDGASCTGIDAIRDITSTLGYKPLIGETKLIIIDEAHRLSSAAITSLLKSIEEPAPHVYFVLATTEIDKIPKAIQTRCQTYSLKAISDDDICDLLIRVCDAEGFTVTDNILELIVEKSNGSPRQALTYLAACSDCKTESEALPLLNSAVENATVIELARYLVTSKGYSWKVIQKFLTDLKGESPESIRMIVINYVAVVISNTKDSAEAARLLNILDAFQGYYNPSEKQSPLILSLGKVVFQ